MSDIIPRRSGLSYVYTVSVLLYAGSLVGCSGSDEAPPPDDVAELAETDAGSGDTEQADVPDVSDVPDAPDVEPPESERSATHSAVGAQRAASGRFQLHTITGPATAETMRTSRFVLRRAAP